MTVYELNKAIDLETYRGTVTVRAFLANGEYFRPIRVRSKAGQLQARKHGEWVNVVNVEVY